MNTEIVATSAVKLSIAQTDILVPFINEGDKEPSWDGTVYIHKDKSKSKNGIKRVSVQVKGKACANLTNDEIIYPVSITDLKNYLYDSGVIFFVVYIADNGNSTKIYFNTLTPIKLRMLIGNGEKQGSLGVKFKEFPNDNLKKISIFLNFYEDKSKQASFVFGKLPTLDELQEQNILEEITFSTTVFGDDRDDPKRALFNNEIYFYAKIKGSSAVQPLEMLPERIQTAEIITQPVSANGFLFYKNYQRVRAQNNETFIFGKSFKMQHYDNSPTWNINYKPAGNISERIQDMMFMENVIATNSFCIRDSVVPINLSHQELQRFDIANHSKQLEDLKEISKALNLLGVNAELDINIMTDKDWANCAHLVRAAIDKQPVSGLSRDLNNILVLDVANLHLALVFEKTDEEGTYNIYDFFKTRFDVAVKDENGEKIPVSQYYLLQKSQYMTLSNIQYDTVLASFKEISNHDQINFSLLEMLLAYDESADSRLLEAITDISKWLLDASDSTLPYEIRLLNWLQSAKRQRQLTKEEKGALCSITERDGQREDILVGAYLLLENQVAAELHFERMDSEIQENFTKYPIHRYWKKQ